MRFVSGVLFAADGPPTKQRSSSAGGSKGKEKDRAEREREKRFEEWGLGLPRAWDILKPAAGSGDTAEVKEGNVVDVLRGCKHVVVIGVHGWFPGMCDLILRLGLIFYRASQVLSYRVSWARYVLSIPESLYS